MYVTESEKSNIDIDSTFIFSFHTYDYARHFVSACTRILGLEGTPEGVEDQGRLTRVAAVSLSNCYLYFVFKFLFFSLRLSVTSNSKQNLLFIRHLNTIKSCLVFCA